MEAAHRDSVVDRTFRHESGRAVATLIRVLGDFDAAEEAVQEAFVVALERWPRDGVPSNPGAWITQVARNNAIDRLRRERNLRDKTAILEGLEAIRPPQLGPAEEVAAAGEIEDDRLRLIFTCCHPALSLEARVALTLRTLGGLGTAEIARAFLVAETTMAQRLVRAKRKIAQAGIPYEVPEAERMPERLPGVLATLYLIFNEGYLASESDSLVRTELSAEAIRLGPGARLDAPARARGRAGCWADAADRFAPPGADRRRRRGGAARRAGPRPLGRRGDRRGTRALRAGRRPWPGRPLHDPGPDRGRPRRGRRPPRRPTGRGSSASTNGSPASPRARSSSSTGRRRWR